jgi:hypothetical protein
VSGDCCLGGKEPDEPIEKDSEKLIQVDEDAAAEAAGAASAGVSGLALVSGTSMFASYVPPRAALDQHE